MLTFKQYNNECIREELLNEKLIVFGNGASYGQVVILAGGGGSGKGFSIDHFMDKTKFKVRDVDDWKRIFLKIAQLKDKYKEIRNLDLSNPNDVERLHYFVDGMGFKNKTIELLVKNAKEDRLPNLMFDMTLRSPRELGRFVPNLVEAGYKPENIHIVWVLTNYEAASINNRNRSRVVPDRILRAGHVGAATVMIDYINGQLPKYVNGSVHVVLNNPEETLYWVKDANGKYVKQNIKNPSREDRNRLAGFTYLTVKKAGEGFTKDQKTLDILNRWIRNNVHQDVSHLTFS